jgi:O-antigen/teichoic acid export membrane protein
MLARKSLLIMSANIIDGVLAYVALFFISRDMGPTTYGILGFAMGFVGLFTILNDLGFNSAHIKRVSEGKDLGTCNGTFIISKLGLSLILIGVTLGAILFWKIVVGRGFESSQQETAIYIILGYYIVNSLAGMFFNVFMAKKEIAKSEIPLIIGAVVRTAAIIFIATLKADAIALAWTYVLGDSICLIAFMFLFRGNPVKKPSKECFKNYTVFAIPVILVGFSSTLITNLDKVLIQLFWSSEDVGYYFASYRIIQFLLVAASSIGILLLPTISSYHVKNDTENIKKIMFLAERYISMFIFPMVIGMIILAEPTVRILLSNNFHSAVPVFMILPFFALLEALSIPYTYQVMGMNKPKIARNRILIMLCVNIVANIILIPKDIQSLHLKLFGLGAIGAAISTVVCYMAGLIYCRIAAWKLLKSTMNIRILLHLFSACIMGITIYALQKIFPIQRWYYLLGFAALGLGIYLFILFLLKEFSRDDWNFLIDVLNIKKMWNYITKELKKDQ